MTNAIEFKGVTVSYDVRGNRVDALQGLNLSVPTGHVFGFLGPNGAGKTTAMHALLGFVEPTAGEVLVFGENVQTTLARRRIGYLAEQPDTYRFLTGRELLSATGRLFGMKGSELDQRVTTVIETVQLSQEASKRRIATYSRGMMQRVCLAQALINDPDLLILDEPTGGLDPLGRRDVRQLIAELRKRGKTVFFSSHELTEVELVCDHVAILHRGRILAEGPAGTLPAPGESLEKYFMRLITNAT